MPPGGDDDDRDVVLAISVARSGGVAAIRRSWTVEPSDDERPAFRSLVVACPWDAADDGGAERDRYVWRIEVRQRQTVRAATLPERRLTGPWRELVDRVREAGDAS
jgi:hypothetical protein